MQEKLQNKPHENKTGMLSTCEDGRRRERRSDATASFLLPEDVRVNDDELDSPNDVLINCVNNGPHMCL